MALSKVGLIDPTIDSVSIRYAANVTGNASVTRSMAVGYTDGRVPQANLDVKGNVVISGATTAAGGLYALNAAGPGFLNEAATSTNPTLVPNRADLDTGVGWGTTNALSLVTAGSERMRILAGGNVAIGSSGGIGFLRVIANQQGTTGDQGVAHFSDTNNFGLTLFGESGGAGFKMNGSQTLSLGDVTYGAALSKDTSGHITVAKNLTATGKLTSSSVTPAFYGANVTGNASVTRSLAVGFTDGRVPRANLEVKGNTYISGATTIAGDITADNFAGRNIVYNGAMKVAQRSTSETGLGAASGYFTTDRWSIAVGAASAGRFTMAQIADGPAGFANCTKLSCTTADTSIAAGEGLRFRQKFEGQDLQQIKKGTASAEQLTISFWVKGNATATYVAELYDNDNGRQISKSFAVTTSWAKITLLIPADTTGAFDDDNAASLELDLWLHAGATYTSGTLNDDAWAAAVSANRAVGISSFFDATSRTFFITGVQMELGAAATEFEHMTYGSELELCKRYYQVAGGGTAYQNMVVAAYFGAGDAVGTYRHSPRLRAVPTVAKSGTWSVLGGAGAVSQTISADQNGPDSIQLGFTGGSSGVSGQATTIRVSNDLNFRLSFDAEL
jgi:hypothetical protein